jgi:inner membrane protein
MDSLTQIILGAATGELAGGKKIGRKAMFWGAVGGTIPDLDVMVGGMFQSIGLFDEMDALAFHRGISHSIFFAIVAPLILGRLVSQHYKNPDRKYVSFFGSVLIYALMGFAVNFVFYEAGGQVLNTKMLVGTIVLGVLVTLFLYRRFFKRKLSEVNASWKIFAWVFFWSIFTHPLLDCCTTYGTQLFQPFSDFRVGLNNIAVADPLYTVPFALCIIFSAFVFTKLPIRRYLTIAGIVISSCYMTWTVYNKLKVTAVIESSLAEKNIQYDGYMSSPTILNNFLWNCVVESDSVYYQSLYSILDAEPKIENWNVYPKNRHLIAGHEEDKSMETLEWFTNGFYNIIELPGDTLQVSDLRFGTIGAEATSPDDFVFKFFLVNKDGVLEAKQSHDRPAVKEDTFAKFFERIKGIKK